MRLAPRKLLSGLLATAMVLAPQVVAAPQRRGSETAEARRQAEAADAARAAALAAQRQAADREAEARAAAAAVAAARVKAAANLREAEARTLAAADRMSELARAESRASEQLDARAATLIPLLPLIERLSLYPAETLLAVPAPPNDAVRGLLILQGVSRTLEHEAAALRQEQARLSEARLAVAEEAPRLTAAEAAQKSAAAELDRQLAAADLDEQQAEAENSTATRRAAEAAQRANSLHGLVEQLDAAERAAEAEAGRLRAEAAKRHHHQPEPETTDSEPVTQAGHGGLLVPVVGSVARAWGAPTEAGPAVGVSYRAAPQARVIAPCNGRVAFAAPFRSYGKLLILDCGGGITVVMAGFDRLSLKPGQTVGRGTPIGFMPDWNPATTGSRPTLYVELRRKGEPVNPAPLWRGS